MSHLERLNLLLAYQYFNRALRNAHGKRWRDARQDLDRFAAILPSDHRAPLLRAKIFLREGEAAKCLDALSDARRLGHNASENKRMVARVVRQDQWQHRLHVVRLRFAAGCRSLMVATGRMIRRGISAIWSFISVVLLALSKFIKAKKSRPSDTTEALRSASNAGNDDLERNDPTNSGDSGSEKLSDDAEPLDNAEAVESSESHDTHVKMPDDVERDATNTDHSGDDVK